MNFVELTNYDGFGAYFDRDRYVVLDIGDEKYAFPVDTEAHSTVDDAVGEERKRLEGLFPVFMIIGEDPEAGTARGFDVTFKRDNLLRCIEGAYQN
ncbi:hypothetical protein J4442_02515 [Candidatus Woesearchaeota archaeon]|nr:hypothetical protein [Candidatus Woesearchaeota archaeon]